MKKTIFLFYLCFIGIIGCKETNSEQKSYIEITNNQQIDSITKTFVDREIYPFLYTRIEDSNGVVAYENLEKNQRLLANENIDGDSWIRIWSMSKIVTICLALDLMEDGIISLNDSVTKYIPEFSDLKVAVTQDSLEIASINWYEDDSLREKPCPIKYVENDSVMTIVHLLNHQAGFYYSTTNLGCLDSAIAEKNVARAENSQDLINKLALLPLCQHPGSYYYYGMNTRNRSNLDTSNTLDSFLYSFTFFF